MTAAKKLQRSPGKALSMTSPLARQMARVRETGSLDVPEKTRFLSPTAVLDRRQEGARNGFRNYFSSRERPFCLLQQFSTGAKKAREMGFETISVLGSSLPFSFSIPCGNLRWRFCKSRRTLSFGMDPYPASNTEVLPVLDFRSHPSEGNTMWFERARFINPQCRRLLLCSVITPLLAVPVAAQDNAEPVAG